MAASTRSDRRPQVVRPSADPPRRIAFEVLRAVAARDAYANLTLPSLLAEARSRGDIDDRGAAFATELAYGTLRGIGTYDQVLAACLTRPLRSVDPPVLDVLRLGAHQVLSMRVPAHAAVAATVDLARSALGKAGHRAAGLVNAVLRGVTRHNLGGWVAELAPSDDRHARLALQYSHPRWIVEAFDEALGRDPATLEALLRADNVAPEVVLAVRPGQASVTELLAGGATAGRWSPYAATLESGDPARLAAVRERRAGVQDEGSQLVALALAEAPVEDDRGRWLDLCAGPGGKSALLSGLLTERHPDGILLANEVQPGRATLVAKAATGAAVIAGDGRRPAWREGSFDRVLVDAPCTGLGALRRRPEARWRRQPEDLADLVPLQGALLEAGVASARPGGLVAYVTCSPHLAETRGVVDALLAGRSDVTRLDARPYFPAGGPWGAGPDVQLWPHRHGTDAMYLSLLRKAT